MSRGVEGSAVQVYPHRTVYRASALGSCTKALVAARLDYEPLAPPPWMQEKYDAGHEAEEVVFEQLKDDGWVTWDRGLEVELQLSTKLWVVGHLDGVGAPRVKVGVAEQGIVEVKSQSDKEWEKGVAGSLFWRYDWQVSAYMLATGMPAWIVRYNRDTGSMAVEEVLAPLRSLVEIRARVLSVEAHAAKVDLSMACDRKDYPCPFYYLHEEGLVEPLDDPNVDKLARRYEEFRQMEKAGKKGKDDTRAALRAGIDGDKVTTTAGTSVTFYPIAGGHREYDVKPSTGMRVTLPKEDDERGDGAEGMAGGSVQENAGGA